MARVAYIRVSSQTQNVDRQLDGVPVDRSFTDKVSAKDVNRPALVELLSFVRDGDTVVVHSMDRLARNLEDLRRLVRDLTDRGVQVEFVKEALTFTGDDSPMATLLLSIMLVRRVRTSIAEGTPTGGHRPGEAARRVQGPQEVPHRRASRRHSAADRRRRAEGDTGAGVRRQPGNALPAPAQPPHHRAPRRGDCGGGER